MKAAYVRAVLFLGAVYSIVGILFGEFAGGAASIQTRVAWRWAAWVVSAAGFGAHIAHEHSLALALSLAIWPVITALPAFVVALVAAILFARVRRSV